MNWFAFKQRNWTSGGQKSAAKEPGYSATSGELTKEFYPRINENRSLESPLKRPRDSAISFVNDDILMSDSWLNGTEEPCTSDGNAYGTEPEETILPLRPRKKIRLEGPQTHGGGVHGDGNDENNENEENEENDEDKENDYPTVNQFRNGNLFDGRRKRKPLGTHNYMGYLDIFSKINASNGSPKERIDRQWKMLDDRVNRTLRQFRGYHHEQSDWEYEI